MLKTFKKLFEIRSRIFIIDLDQVTDGPKAGLTKKQLFNKIQEKNLKISDIPLLNLSYLAPIVTMLILIFQTIGIFILDNFKFGPAGSPELFSRHFFPIEMWSFADVILGVAMLMALVVYFNLMIDPGLDKRYVMYLFESLKWVKIIENRQGTVQICRFVIIHFFPIFATSYQHQNFTENC